MKWVRRAVAAAVIGVVTLTATPASGHVHRVVNPSHEQKLANEQNHPGFVFNSVTARYESCAGVNEPADAGPAGYGLETAHHGPDAGSPGKGDGCFATVNLPSSPAADSNPAID